jgi:hypothetical protein
MSIFNHRLDGSFPALALSLNIYALNTYNSFVTLKKNKID